LVWSQKFGDKERGMWQLKLYPYGDASAAGRGHVSLFLSLDLKSLDAPKAYAIFGCYLLDENGEKVAGSGRSFTRQKFADGSSSWGWSQFIKVEGQSLNKLLSGPSDSMVVKCDIDVFTGISAAPARKMPQPALWTDEIKSILSNPMYHDVRIHLADNAGIRKANRVALVGRSKFFASILSPLKAGQSDGVSTTTTAPTVSDLSGVGTSHSSFFGSRSIAGLQTESIKPLVPGGSASSSFTPFGPSYASFGWTPEIAGTDPQVALNSKQQAPPSKAIDSIFSANRMVVAHNINSIEMTEIVPIEAFDNMLAFIHTDDCNYMTERTSLTKVLDLFILSKQFEVEALYNTLMRRLCSALVSKSTAIAIQRVASKLGAADLEEECQSFLLTCARDLTEEEIIKAIVPKAAA